MQLLITILILLLAVAYVIHRLCKAFRGQSRGHYGCAGCPLRDSCKGSHPASHK